MPVRGLLISFFISVVMFLPLACSSDAPQSRQQQAIPITDYTVTQGNLPITKNYTGQTTGIREIQIRAQVAGVLLKRYYTEGDMVKQGQSLFLIDPAPYQAELARVQGDLAQAKASFTNAQLEYDRVIPLYAKNAVSQKVRDQAVADLNTAKANAAAAQANVKTAEINLGYTRVYAPFDGMSSVEAVTEGNLINAGDLLTKVTQLDPIYVTFAIPNIDMYQFRALQAENRLQLPEHSLDVHITMVDGSEYPLIGKPNFMDSVVDPSTASVKVRAIFDNPKGQIFPGQFVSVFTTGVSLKDAISIPMKTVVQTQQGPMVWIIGDDNKVKIQAIKILMTFGNDAVVQEGLKAGQRIVVDGLNKMHDNALVAIQKPGAEKPNAQNQPQESGNAK